MSRPVSLAGLLLALALVGCTSAGGTGGDATGDAARGEALFKQSTIGTASAPGCSTCHSLDGTSNVGRCGKTDPNSTSTSSAAPWA